ncbi:MAG TPA: leucyl aminopeptidase [Thermoanaerobaculia bacterium]|nr:leucyl aminopeptidase [Thermoanaerobaculia bacterium]
MKVEISREPKLSKLDHLFVLVTEKGELNIDGPIGSIARNVAKRSDFEGRSEETITVLEDQPRKITLVGLGKQEKYSIRCLRGALFNVARIAQKQRDRRIAVAVATPLPGFEVEPLTRLTASMLAHADYKYDAYQTQEKENKRIPIDAMLIPPLSLNGRRLRDIEEEANAISEGMWTVRDLGNAPSNVITPARLAERAMEVSKKVGVKCTVFGRREIEKMKMGGLIAVNRGSSEEPRFVVMEYAPRRAKKHVALVGKGVTFDSGGISIKPAEKMEEMKYDMCGAAAVIGTIEAAAKLELPVRITGCIPSTDNLPSGSAYKPGEIITMMNGKTVEIVNTDAEGRMILGDALHYASKLEPDHLIDFATLTGSCVVALASEAAGLFSNDDALARKLIECGERVGERLWRLPAWDEYKELIKSEWADMKNSGGRWGGAITAAVFLKEFVDCPSWAHLDIAGTAYSDRDPKGATGAGVRVAVEFLESLSR